MMRSMTVILSWLSKSANEHPKGSGSGQNRGGSNINNGVMAVYQHLMTSNVLGSKYLGINV